MDTEFLFCRMKRVVEMNGSDGVTEQWECT